MHIRLLAFGTRGDVQPYVALALGLQQAGFDVSIGTSEDFRDFVEAYGLPCATAEVNIRAFVNRSDAQSASGSRRQQRMAILRRIMDGTLQLAENADMLIYSPVSAIAAPYIVQQRGLKSVVAMLQPYLHATAEMPVFGLPRLPLGGSYNRFTYRMFAGVVGLSTNRVLRAWQQDTFGSVPDDNRAPLQMVLDEKIPTLYGYSPYVLPSPDDWPPHVHVTGYWFLPGPSDWQPSTALTDFLNAGNPPVYIGFGSMTAGNPEQTTAIVLEALELARARGILSTGWAGLDTDNVPDNVLLVDDTPHDWLFPRLAAVAHHGGAGTTAAGMLAGIPSIVIPQRGDQPFWGRRVAQLGVGPEPIPYRQLTAERLASAIREARLDATMRERACALSRTLEHEDGVGNAVRVIERVAEAGKPQVVAL